MKNMEAEEYEKIFSYLSDGSYIKGKDFLFIYQYQYYVPIFLFKYLKKEC
jgi:hypothetical protein